MLSIKLRPVGKRKQISYRIAIMEKKSKLKGKFIEDLGWYNPHTNKFAIKNERAKYWVSVGAQPTDSIHNILVDAKISEGPKISLYKKSKKIPVEKPVEVPVLEVEKKEELKKEEIKENVVEEISSLKPIEEIKSSEEASPTE